MMNLKTKTSKIAIDAFALKQLTLLKNQSAAFKIKLPGRMLHLFLWISITFIGICYYQSIGLAIAILALINYLVLMIFRIKNNFQSNKKLDSLTALNDIEWPTFSIIFPLKNEDEVIHKTINAIQVLDYPKDKLQVLVVVEDSDLLTLQSLSAIDLPPYFKLLLIPTLTPFTKGRALLHGLAQVTGEYLTVLDAESHPEPMQLKKAAICLTSSKAQTCCQAKIRVSNKGDNWITRNFATEYHEWYEQHLYK